MGFFPRRTDVKDVSFYLLEEGRSVKFNVGWGSKGFQARNVELIKEGGQGCFGRKSK